MSREASFRTFGIPKVCSEHGCDQVPVTVGVGIIWADRKSEIYVWCDEHAKAAMARARDEKAAEEGLQ